MRRRIRRRGSALGLQLRTLRSVGDDLEAAFGLDPAGIEVPIALLMAPGQVLALPAGALDRLASDRALPGPGLATLAAGEVARWPAQASPAIGAGRLRGGAGFLLASLPFTQIVADGFEGREIAAATSVPVMRWPFGIAMSQVDHGWLAEAFGWRSRSRSPPPGARRRRSASGCSTGPRRRRRAPPPPCPPGRPAPCGAPVCAGAAWGAFVAGDVIRLQAAPRC